MLVRISHRTEARLRYNVGHRASYDISCNVRWGKFKSLKLNSEIEKLYRWILYGIKSINKP